MNDLYDFLIQVLIAVLDQLVAELVLTYLNKWLDTLVDE